MSAPRRRAAAALLLVVTAAVVAPAAGAACNATEAQQQCHANAACTITSGVFNCTCKAGYNGDGKTCTDVDECALGTYVCSPNATCTNTVGSYNCSCKPGFSGNGKTCADVNECTQTPSKCGANAVCTNFVGGYNCTCKTGYSGDGVTCSDVDECALGTYVCSPNATCTNTFGSYNCSCKPGFSGNGKTCADVDECALGTASCAANASCSNTAGGYDCLCPPGFSGDGKVSCSDVDECALGTASCAANATCSNTAGSYDCLCLPGFFGNGKVSCSDVDECTVSNVTCAANATCSNRVGGYDCLCSPGFSGDGTVSCSDVDECALGTASCAANATCSNTAGGYDCLCSVGFSGDGKVSCSDVDECALGTASCAANATCSNTAGSYDCLCAVDFFGDGKVSCTASNTGSGGGTMADPCQSSPPPCDANAACSWAGGSANASCSCHFGYIGDGVTCSVNAGSGPAPTVIISQGSVEAPASVPLPGITLSISPPATQMCISNTPSCTAGFEPFQSPVPWTLPGAGALIVYVWTRDAAGATSPAGSASVVLNAKAALLALKSDGAAGIVSGGPVVKKNTVDLVVTATANQMCITDRKSASSKGCTRWVPYVANKQYRLTGEGRRSIVAWFRNAKTDTPWGPGNVTVVCDRTAPKMLKTAIAMGGSFDAGTGNYTVKFTAAATDDRSPQTRGSGVGDYLLVVDRNGASPAPKCAGGEQLAVTYAGGGVTGSASVAVDQNSVSKLRFRLCARDKAGWVARGLTFTATGA